MDFVQNIPMDAYNKMGDIMSEKSILLTGGGTAGHVMPNIALLPELRKRFDVIYYMGRPQGVERTIAEENGLEYIPVRSRGFDRSHILKNISLIGELYKEREQAIRLIGDRKIDLVFSKGGYASYPAVMYAKSRNIPLVIHESDISVGLANRLAARYARAVITSFPETKIKRSMYIGNPIREQIFRGIGQLVRERYNMYDKPVLLAMGGSQGAANINRFITSNISELKKRFNVILIAGKTCEPVQDRGFVTIGFARDIQNYFAAADVILSRCGANSAFELAALGKKVIFIPLERGSRGDQLQNAEYFSRYFGMGMIRERDLTLRGVYDLLNEIGKPSRPIYRYPLEVCSDIATLLYEVACRS